MRYNRNEFGNLASGAQWKEVPSLSHIYLSMAQQSFVATLAAFSVS
jgi:hypothetical protein